MLSGADDDPTQQDVSAPDADRTVVSPGAPAASGTGPGPRVSTLGETGAPAHLSSIFGETERYSARAWIGEGGMGTVIRAFDKDLEREVAIKVIGPNAAGDNEALLRFSEEARITGQLEHPFIVPVYEFGSDPHGTRFLCMKLVEGTTLEDALEGAGASRLSPSQLADSLQVLLKVCDAVSFAHSRGVIHRDLKPANVMIGKFGQVYVMDWGLAIARGSVPDSVEPSTRVPGKLPTERPGSLMGTPSYMAPEQLLGRHERLDERTDVYALGATLYEILTGTPPRSLHEVRAMLAGGGTAAILSPDEVVGPGIVPPELSRIALKALAQEPGERYATVNELKADIERFQRGTWHLPNRRFGPGSAIVTEGDLGETAYIIVSGRCEAYRVEAGVEVSLREMGPGEVFGETAVLSRKPRTASVRAVTEVVLLEVTAEILSNALGLGSWMGSFVRALAERFREADEQLRRIHRP
ncbi:MAG: protein kinase [Pseudomonadota bacterium]